ncbi:TonB-dependent receptor plug domain-containing protein [Marinivivus vitaminiproducens]|uniref:TonB-dependent receptor plug domain-containing protein n=1 Tax=Marinivivus vitaminiproducens TaxID=3035935 RepID=UPI0027A2A8C7|nr:TonB-dependent receptor [Geminicoccaceae bacterium SCSIO 64248]
MPRWSRWLLVAAPLAAAGSSAAQEQGADSPVLLPPLSVTANLVDTPARAVGSALTVVDAEQLAVRQTRLVSDVLREVPGVAVNRTGSVGQLTQLRIRGAEGNQTLVLIDGVKANDPSAGSEFDFAHLQAADIERIEVLRGPQSALYGSDALGGVVNIVTKRGEGPATVRLRAEGGTFDTTNTAASLSGGNERYDFRVTGESLRTDGISTADERLGNDEQDGYRNNTGSAKLAVRPHDGVELSLVGRFTRYEADGDDFLGGIGAVDADQETRGRERLLRAQGRFDLLEGSWQHILGASYNDTDRDLKSDGVVSTRYEGRTRQLDYQTNVLFDTSRLAEADHTLTFAFQREWTDAESSSAFAAFDRDIDTNAFVGQYQIDLADALALSASVRHERNDAFDDTTTYRLTAAYRIEGSGTKLRTSYGTGVKNPSLFELYGFTETYQGNPDLDPEEGWGWDVGVDQELWGDRVVVDATYFEQRIEDLITGAGETSVNLPGTSKIRGAEFGLSIEPIDDVVLRAAYTYTHGEDANGDELVRRPKHIASFNANYRFLDDRANVNLGIVYNGRQDDLAFDENFNASTVSLDSYTLVNLAASYRLSEHAELFGRIENLFDESYEEVDTYGSPGRAAYAGLGLTF